MGLDGRLALEARRLWLPSIRLSIIISARRPLPSGRPSAAPKA